MLRRYVLTSFVCWAILCVSAISFSMPFRPDVVKKLREKGELKAASQLETEARKRGLNQAKPYTKLRRDALGAVTSQELTALVLLVDFSDNAADTFTYPPSHYVEQLFSEGVYPTGSVQDYYLETSGGKLSFTGVVVPWTRLGNTYAYYVAGQAGLGPYPFNAQALVEELLVAANPAVDYSQFDNDGPDGIPDSGDDDGLVDVLIVVHAGPGREETHSMDDIHSHQWSTSVPLNLDGVWLYSYAIQPDNGKVGVFCHEMGHLIGLPDLYDTDYSSCGAGNWSVMASGSWGGPVGAAGTRPVHFDGWSKQRAGFVSVVTPESNLTSVELEPVQTGGEVYRFWDNGLPTREYFMGEFRTKTGFDEYLPGEGLLIYHVDETKSGNDDESRYLVDVEEAHGAEDLKYCTNRGDAGDPFPGTSANHEFSKLTTPSSLSNDGIATQVSLTEIDTADGKATFSLQVEDLPRFVWRAPSLVDSLGDDDGVLDPGETVVVNLCVENIGVSSGGLTALAEVLDDMGYAILHEPTCEFDPVAAESTATGNTPLILELDPSAPDPYGVPFEVSLIDSAFNVFIVEGVIVAGDSVGLKDSFESGGQGWTNEVASGDPNYIDEWHLSTQRNHTAGGGSSFKCGDSGIGNYGPRNDAALMSPWFNADENSILRFYYWVDAEVLSEDLEYLLKRAWDGGVVEASIDGFTWDRLTPEGGYPFSIELNPDSKISGERGYSGSASGWKEAVFDLSEYQGPLQLRFRFCSDGSVGGEGWYIDDVEVMPPSSIDERPAAPERIETAQFGLKRGYPNPFNPLVDIEYVVARTSNVTVSVYDVSGALVKVLFEGSVPAGSHRLSWDGRDTRGRKCGAGVYFVRLSSGGRSDALTITLVK